MYKTAFVTASALALALTLGAGQVSAQTATTAAKGQLASPAQLKREHNRAVKAGDTANDPYDSSSSDALNQQQLANAQAATAAAPGATAPDMASAPMTDANTGVSDYTSANTEAGASTDAGNTGVDTSTATTNDNMNNNASTDTDTTALPPVDQPGTATGTQDNGSASMPSSSLPSSTSMPQSSLPGSTDATTPQ